MSLRLNSVNALERWAASSLRPLHGSESHGTMAEAKNSERFHDAERKGDKEEKVNDEKETRIPTISTSFVIRRFIMYIEKLKQQEIITTETIFKNWDKNGDGVLTGLELWRGAYDMGLELSSEELREIKEKFDHDHDGTISLEEWIVEIESAAARAERPSRRTEGVTFKPKPAGVGTASGLSSNGRLRSEVLKKFRAALVSVTESRDDRTGRVWLNPRQAFEEIDADGDGRLDRFELRKACNALSIRPPLSPEELDWIFEEYGDPDHGTLRYGQFVDFLEA